MIIMIIMIMITIMIMMTTDKCPVKTEGLAYIIASVGFTGMISSE